MTKYKEFLSSILEEVYALEKEIIALRDLMYVEASFANVVAKGIMFKKIPSEDDFPGILIYKLKQNNKISEIATKYKKVIDDAHDISEKIRKHVLDLLEKELNNQSDSTIKQLYSEYFKRWLVIDREITTLFLSPKNIEENIKQFEIKYQLMLAFINDRFEKQVFQEA